MIRPPTISTSPPIPLSHLTRDPVLRRAFSGSCGEPPIALAGATRPIRPVLDGGAATALRALELAEA
jgi:hypothetical protein